MASAWWWLELMGRRRKPSCSGASSFATRLPSRESGAIAAVWATATARPAGWFTGMGARCWMRVPPRQTLRDCDAEADAEERLVQVVGVLEEQLVDGLAAGVGGGGLGSGSWPYFCGLTSAPLPGRRMPWQLLIRSATAACGRSSGTSRLRLRSARRIGVLRPGALAVGEVGAVGDGDGDAGLHGSWPMIRDRLSLSVGGRWW